MLLFIFIMMPLTTSVNAPTTYLSVKNLDTGGSNFSFPPSTPPGTKFWVNITITEVSNLKGWQVNLTYNPLLINTSASDVVRPTDNILADLDPTAPAKIIDNTIGYVVWACAIGPNSPYPSFNGSGTLFQIRFTFTKNGTGDPVFSDLNFDTAGIMKTKLANPLAQPISFTAQNGLVTIPEFPNGILVILLLMMTLLAFAFGKVARSKRWHRPIAN